MENYSDFGLEARKKMLEKKMTLTTLAKELGISLTYLSEILRGTREGTGQKEKIAQILELKGA